MAETAGSGFLLRRIRLLATCLTLAGTVYMGGEEPARASQDTDRVDIPTVRPDNTSQVGSFTASEASILSSLATETQSVRHPLSLLSQAEASQGLDDWRPQVVSTEKPSEAAGADRSASLELKDPGQDRSALNGKASQILTDASLPPSSTADASISQDANSNSSPWKFEFTPYLWAPVNVDADLSTSRRTVSRTLTFSQITSAIDTPPLSGRLEAWKGNFGLLTEGYLIGLSGVQSRSRDLLGIFPAGAALEASTLLAFWDVAASYHIGRQPLLRSGESPSSFSGAYAWFEPYAGMRLSYLEATTNLTLTLGPLSTSSSVGRNTTYVSPLVGAVVGMQASQRVALLLRGDVSGFGINGDPNLAWRVAALADVQPLSFLDLTLKIGYQVFSFNYGKDDLEVKLLGHGPWLGLTFRM